MKEYKYTIEGKEYKVEIGDISDNIAEVTVNGETFKVEMEPEAEPEKKKVVLGKPTENNEESQATPAANVKIPPKPKSSMPPTFFIVALVPVIASSLPSSFMQSMNLSL